MREVHSSASAKLPAPVDTVLEAGPRAGGVLETVHRDGYLIEHSADNFITNVPWAIDLCRRIGLGDHQSLHAAANVHEHAKLADGRDASGVTPHDRTRPRIAVDPYRTGAEGLYICSASTPPG